jgi:hypothetical protein
MVASHLSKAGSYERTSDVDERQIWKDPDAINGGLFRGRRGISRGQIAVNKAGSR